MLEQQLGTSWGVSATYLGSYSDRLWAQSALNPGVFLGLGPCTLNTATGPRTFPVCSTNGEPEPAARAVAGRIRSGRRRSARSTSTRTSAGRSIVA